MIRKIFVVAMFSGLAFCANAQEVFDLHVNSFETVLKRFRDAKYQPDNRCEEFVERRRKLNSLSLYIGAVHCSRQNYLANAANLLAMADVKFQFDQIRYPVAVQNKQALLGVAFIRAQAFSPYGNEILFQGESDIVRKISNSLMDWDINISEKESPGWLYSEKLFSNQDLKSLWIHFKNAKISAIESAGFFLKKPELTSAKQNWTAAVKSLDSARALRKDPDPDGSPHLSAIVQAMEQREKTASEVYFRLLNEIDNSKRPHIRVFEKSINIGELMVIDPITLNPIDEVRGSIYFSLVSPYVREFKFNLEHIQPAGHSVDALHFMSYCVAELIVRSEPEFKGWQIGTNQENFSDLKFRVKLLKSKNDVSREDYYKFSDPIWLPNENFKQSCRFIRPGYFEKKS